MSRYRGPRLRITRRLGELPGLTQKTSSREYRPGQHGKNQRKPTEYATRLEEKQKLRLNYGLKESQLISYVRKARRIKGSTGQVLLQLLEMRLDSIIFRLGMAPTIPASRQLINHGHIKVNGQRVNIASYDCQPGDTISIADKDQSKKLVQNYLNFPSLANIPNHLTLDTDNLQGNICGIIEREWVAIKLNELLVVEYYSRKA